MLSVRAPKDFWTGVMFIAFGAIAMIVSRNYSLGAAGRMGPGYFPLLLGGLLAVIGLALVVRSFVIDGAPVGRIAILPLCLIVLSVILFGVLLQHAGLIIALLVVIGVSALASRESRPLEVAALAAVVTVFSVAVFVYGLRLPLPVWPQF
jgi:hypothetical protein